MQLVWAFLVLLTIILVGWAVANIGMIIMAFVAGAVVGLGAVAYFSRKPSKK